METTNKQKNKSFPTASLVKSQECDVRGNDIDK